MIATKLVNIRKAQDIYYEKLVEYQKTISGSDISIKKITVILDDIKFFWLERLEIVEFELEELATNYRCFLLSGAIYLNISSKEHYYFKSLGDFHLLSDPLLKMEAYFRLLEGDTDNECQIEYFKDIFNDMVEILKNYRYCFFVLPINEITNRGIEDRLEVLQTFYVRFISNLFQKDFDNEEMFCKAYSTYEEIENDLDDQELRYLIINDYNDSKLSLRKRIERYSEIQMGASDIMDNKSEAQSFWIIFYSQISQIADTFLTCTYLGLTPYIRNEVTFNYLMLSMNAFLEDKNFRSLIEKTIVFYIFYRTTDKERIENVDFAEYCHQLGNKPTLMDKILKTMHSQGIEVNTSSVKSIENIISKEFESLVMEPK